MAGAHDQTLLSITALAKRFASGGGVDDVSLSVSRGGVTGFIGVNGAGKSTTLRCAMGLLQPDAGSILLFGQVADWRAWRRVGFLPEERGLFAHERVRDAIAFHARLKGIPKREALKSADRLLERIGLGHRQRARIGDLSKGNAQRVQILCALAHGPELLILDEPMSGLDPVAQSEILALFAEFRANGGGILVSTHAMAAAESLCDEVAILANGRTVFHGSLSDASKLSPHGAVVVTSDSAALQAAASAIGADARPMTSSMGEAQRWRILLPKAVTHPALMHALADHGAPVLAFEPIRADLEGLFWDVAAAPAAPQVRAA